MDSHLLYHKNLEKKWIFVFLSIWFVYKLTLYIYKTCDHESGKEENKGNYIQDIKGIDSINLEN